MTRRRQVAAVTLLAVGLIGSYAGWRARPRAASGAVRGLDSNVVAVLPFHVDEADPALGDLRDWLQDLLVARLTGDGSPRAVDPREVAKALRRTNASGEGDLSSETWRRVAHELGAGLVLGGEVAGTSDRPSLAATLVAVPSGAVRAAAQVQGVADSLPNLADRLTARLLAIQAASGGEELAALSSTSLAALRAYLAGWAYYRRGKIHEAEEHFDRALYLDSTLLPAELGRAAVQANYWHWRSGSEQWQADAVWSRRHRMRPPDRALLVAYLGPRYPRPSRLAELIAAGEEAARLAPENVEAWLTAAVSLRNYGRTIAAPDWEARSVAALRRALALDSTHAPTLELLLPLAARAGDTAAVRRYVELYLSNNADALMAGFLRWRAAVALGDSAALTALRPQFANIGEVSLWHIVWWSQLDGVGLGDADSAVEVLLRTSQAAVGHAIAVAIKVNWLVNRGRPAEASRMLRDFSSSPAWNDFVGPAFPIYAALYLDGDRDAAAVAARRLEASVQGSTTGPGEARDRQTANCVLALWRVTSGDFAGTRAALARIGRVATSIDALAHRSTAVCVATVEALLAAGQHQLDAATLEHLDSLLRVAWCCDLTFYMIGNLVAARLYEARGNLPRALEAVRRAGADLPTQQREEGRLAALSGDRIGAIRAYRHYLALRSNPEPALVPEAERVRAELQRLEHPRTPP